jgi:membrane protein DedA with SNARE-associated domain
LPPALIYLVLAAGAAVENVVPPVPADTFVLLGAFLAEAGRANLWLVFALTWFSNVTTAIIVYALARRWGSSFFRHGTGRFLLHQHQLDQISKFYGRWGVAAILVSRFLPAFRAMVPVFAGVTELTALRVVPPLALASGIWYGLLVVLGSAASRNWDVITRLFGHISGWLAAVAGVLLVAVGVWWWKSRRARE